jgi:hypothetical protein
MMRSLKLGLVAVALLGSVSLALAQDGRVQRGTGQLDFSNAYNATGGERSRQYGGPQSLTPSGPYRVPPHLTPSQNRPLLPFTWEEKRWFDQATGEEG